MPDLPATSGDDGRMRAAHVRVLALADAGDVAGLLPGIEAILFETASRSYAPGPEREAFRERWLGRFLTHDAAHAFVALLPDGRVVGYLVGALDDPARSSRFADLAYFRDFAALTVRFPAHLHINLTAGWRGLGIGERLIEAFGAHAVRRGAPGMHVVTGAGARNVGFYAKCGFRQAGRTVWNGHDIVLLGRLLGAGRS